MGRAHCANLVLQKWNTHVFERRFAVCKRAAMTPLQMVGLPGSHTPLGVPARYLE